MLSKSSNWLEEIVSFSLFFLFFLVGLSSFSYLIFTITILEREGEDCFAKFTIFPIFDLNDMISEIFSLGDKTDEKYFSCLIFLFANSDQFFALYFFL